MFTFASPSRIKRFWNHTMVFGFGASVFMQPPDSILSQVSTTWKWCLLVQLLKKACLGHWSSSDVCCFVCAGVEGFAIMRLHEALRSAQGPRQGITATSKPLQCCAAARVRLCRHGPK